MAKRFKYLIRLCLGTILIMSAGLIASFVDSSVDKLDSSQSFAETLDEKTSRTINIIERIQNDIHQKGARRTQLEKNDYFESLFDEEGILIAVFRKNELALWSHNAISPQNLLEVAANGTEIHKFDNGWYRLIYMSNGIDQYCGAIQIKQTFPYTNKYLDNGFRPGFDQPSIDDIHINGVPGSVKLKADHQPFFITFSEKATSHVTQTVIFVLLNLMGAILILSGVFLLVHKLFGNATSVGKTALIVFLLILLRYFSLVGGWPSYVSGFGLFSPMVYASSSIFPSLIDFTLNVVVLFILCIELSKFLGAISNKSLTKLQSLIILCSGIIGLFVFGWWINILAKGLVVNSNIPFDINDIIGLNGYSFAGIVSIALLYFSFFKLAQALMRFASSTDMERLKSLLLIAILTAALVGVSHIMGIVDLVYVLWPPTVLVALAYFQFYTRLESYNLGRIILAIVFFAAVGSHNFIKYSQTREHAQRQVLSEKLAVDDDPIAELLYSDVTNRMRKDKGIQNVFIENELHTREILQDYVLSRYFTGYWSKYNIEMYTYLADSTVWGKLSSVRPRTFREITEHVAEFGEATPMNEELYYMYNSNDLVTYIAILPLHYSLSAEPDGFFVFELSSKLFPQQLGFPSLLIDEGSNSFSETATYASARYVQGRLISSRGDYPYQSHPGSFDKLAKPNTYVRKRGYEHLVSHVDQNTTVVISKALKSPLDKITTLSYLCAIFGLAYALAILVNNLFKRKMLFQLNLNQKIQGLLVLLTSTSLVFFVFATQYYITKNYTEKNQRQISEKMQSILLEVEHKLGDEESLNYDMTDLLNRLLSQFSIIFFTDINLYSPDGALLASSQMRMFNEGLISRKIHPEAFAHLKYLDQVEYIHEEKVGKMAYLSGYTPFYNSRGELLAYVNLPYFAKQTELENEISSFLVAVINVFILLFLLSILFGLYTSQWITSPLRAIRESLAGIELGKTNRLIGYAGTDEIGRLVQEYNTKVAELEHNAEKLAQSERESAWREMAKQVAHEIKNPLTPMKLSVQHLERTIQNGDEIDPDHITRLTTNLVDQIDALTGIANAFSNFAQMPKAQTKELDLKELLQNAAKLFDGFEHIHIGLDIEITGDVRVLADKEQLLRVFNNVLKNAVQSIDSAEKGRIRILIKSENKGYLISISDNGKGIAREDYSKIFVPNFTTKTRGMGLGLALAKNIVEQANGKIWFESEEKKGTVFFVWLPSL